MTTTSTGPSSTRLAIGPPDPPQGPAPHPAPYPAPHAPAPHAAPARRLPRLLTSLGVSVGVHLLLLALLLTVALQVAPWQSPADSGAPVLIAPAQTMDPSLAVARHALDGALLPDVPPAPAPAGGADPADLLPAPIEGSGALASANSGPGFGVPADLAELLARGAGNGVQFAGLRARRASRIVYVVDGSGAMVTSLPFVLEELQRSVARLGADQRFAVVLFRNRPPDAGGEESLFEVLAGPEGDLLRAGADARTLLRRWAERLSPEGLSNPLDGLTRAFAFSPDAVFLLARSIPRSGHAQWGSGTEAILRELERVNPLDPRTGERSAAIKTIQFLAEDPTGTMPAIGLRHGDGTRGEPGYRLLTLDDLGALPAGGAPAEAPIDPGVERAVDRLSSLRASRADIALLFGLADDQQIAAAADSCRVIIGEAGGNGDGGGTGGGDGGGMALFAQERARMLLAHATGDAAMSQRARARLEDLAGRREGLLSALAGASALSAMLPDGAGSADVLARLAAIEDELAETDPLSLAEAQLSAIKLTGDPELIARIERAMNSAPFVPHASDVSDMSDVSAASRDAALSLAACEVIAEARLARGDPRAFDPLVGLLAESDLPPDALLDRIARLAPDDLALEGAHPDVLYAEGLDRARKGLPSGAVLLAQAADRADEASPAVRRRASRDAALARLAAADGSASEAQEQAQAIESLWTYVAGAEGAPDRARMLAACLTACDRFGPGDDRVERVRRSASELFATADFASEARRTRPEAGLWISRHARNLLLDCPDSAESRRQALQLLETVPAGDQSAALAARLRVHARSLEVAELRRRIDAATRAGPEADRQVDPAAIVPDLAVRILAECEAMAQDVIAHAPKSLDRWRLDRADASVELGEAPVETYQALGEAGPLVNVPGGEPRRLIGLARAHLNAGRADLAFPILRDLAERLDAPAPGAATARPDAFWQAWGYMMEILRERRGRAGDARIRVMRLHEIDPQLGGEPWRSMILSGQPEPEPDESGGVEP